MFATRPVIPDDATHSDGSALPALVSNIPGPASIAEVDVLARHESPAITARRARAGESRGVGKDPIVWAAARGANVWDVDGNRFVDLTAAFGVALIGHAHPDVRAAVHAQTELLLHGMGDVYPNGPRIALMAELARRSPGGALTQCILASGGAEAVEAALKTALMAARRVANDRTGVLAFWGGYHGLSYGALAATAYRGDFRRPFAGQLATHVRHLPYGCDLALIEGLVRGPASGGESIGTVLVEPIQGRGGEVVPPAGWLPGLRALCDRHGLVLVFDEVFTGLGRTGDWWAGDHEGAVPDVVACGKALGGGLPIGACMARPEVMRAWGQSEGEAIHTSTFLGNPVTAAASLATLKAMDDLHVTRRAKAFEVAARAFFEPRGVVVRGRGAMLGLELGTAGAAARVTGDLLKTGWLVLPSGVAGDVLGLTPPLVLTDEQRDAAFEAIATAIAAVV